MGQPPQEPLHGEVDEALLVELHQLDVPAVRVERGADLVEHILDLRENLRRHDASKRSD